MKKISIVIPAHNEEGNLSVIHERINDVFQTLSQYDFEIIFVNDGSTDSTQQVIENLSSLNSEIKYIEFSRNFGHQPAVKAGIDNAFGDAVISMDADLQHPPELIPELLKKWEEGYEMVYTIREYTDETSYLKKASSNLFYKILSMLSDFQLEKGSGADFRLLDASVVNVIRGMGEHEIFLRGTAKWVGFRQTGVAFQAFNRLTGESKYNFNKMLTLAFTGITAFSIRPLYLAAYLGFFFSGFSVLFYTSYVIWTFIADTDISGWASLIMTIVFFGGLQLTILGIIGIYLGKAFKELKGRPNYIIRRKNF